MHTATAPSLPRVRVSPDCVSKIPDYATNCRVRLEISRAKQRSSVLFLARSHRKLHTVARQLVYRLTRTIAGSILRAARALISVWPQPLGSTRFTEGGLRIHDAIKGHTCVSDAREETGARDEKAPAGAHYHPGTLGTLFLEWPSCMHASLTRPYTCT